MKSLHIPPQFDSSELDLSITLMREHPLAQLISLDDHGSPFVTPLPILVQRNGAEVKLLGHCAKPNPHWRYLQARPNALVTFMGPHAYMSPGVYPDLTRVPTWSYLTVHCAVTATLIEDATGKDRLLKALIAEHEPAYAAQWRSLGDDYQQKMLSGIVAFELMLTRLDCKFKLNQHRPESHVAMHSTYAQGTADERALALWMQRLGMVSSDVLDDSKPK